MKKIKDFLLTSLGPFGIILFYLVSIFITLCPLLMFEMSWWLYLLLTLVVQLVVVNIPLGLEALWIVGLFGAVSGKQDVFAIIYYVLFALIIGSAIVRIVKVFTSK